MSLGDERRFEGKGESYSSELRSGTFLGSCGILVSLLLGFGTVSLEPLNRRESRREIKKGKKTGGSEKVLCQSLG